MIPNYCFMDFLYKLFLISELLRVGELDEFMGGDASAVLFKLKLLAPEIVGR